MGGSVGTLFARGGSEVVALQQPPELLKATVQFGRLSFPSPHSLCSGWLVRNVIIRKGLSSVDFPHDISSHLENAFRENTAWYVVKEARCEESLRDFAGSLAITGALGRALVRAAHASPLHGNG